MRILAGGVDTFGLCSPGGDAASFPYDVFLCGSQRHSGGYSAGVPPLPIPNREVKPGRADGTA